MVYLGNTLNSFEPTIPDSELCQKATALVKQVSPPFLHNHCLRTYLFGQQLGHKNQLKVDPELLYLGAIMHDLGLTEAFNGQQRFEVDGADAAKKFVKKHGLCDEKADIIWDAIALHTSIGIASRKRPEIALVHLGAGLDVFGMGANELSADIVHQVFETHPRLELADSITQLLVEQVKRKPQVVPFTWLAEIGRSCIHGFTCPSYKTLMDNSPFS
jgi:hypothetical protein